MVLTQFKSAILKLFVVFAAKLLLLIGIKDYIHIKLPKRVLFFKYKAFDFIPLIPNCGIKLVYRECNSSSYNLVQAFLGPVKAGFYQAFAWAFGASLKKDYDPNGVDRLTERVVLQVEAGQL